jgi:hypothetical protein
MGAGGTAATGPATAGGAAATRTSGTGGAGGGTGCPLGAEGRVRPRTPVGTGAGGEIPLGAGSGRPVATATGVIDRGAHAEGSSTISASTTSSSDWSPLPSLSEPPAAGPDWDLAASS